MADELVTIGRIIKPHGIRGEVAVEVLSDVPGRFDAGVAVQVAGRTVRIATSRPHQGRMLVRFEEVTDRTAAELLRGRDIEAPPVDVSESETYYVHELVGMAVVDGGSTRLGVVTALIELPSAAGYDLLEVTRDDGATWLLPAVDDLVEVDEDEDGTRRLRVVDAPPGLLDLDAAESAPDDTVPPDGTDPSDDTVPPHGRAAP